VTPAIRRTARAHQIPVVRRVGLVGFALGAMFHGQPALAADPVHGQQVYKTCLICHSLEKNGAGPKHAGVFGRTAGTVPDYRYSVALQKSGIVWNAETLDQWLADPQAMVPGTKMFFAVDSARDRADVIEFLREKAATP
jgi:cytochrome c